LKRLAGQQYLEIYAVNSSVAAATAQATGVYHHPRTGSAFHNLPAVQSTLRTIQQFWSSKLHPTPAVAIERTLIQSAARPEPPDFECSVPADECDLLQLGPSHLLYLSSYYWTYAFCASSSLFSSYSFAQSAITTHEYQHSFCDCHARQRHRYSVLLDRKTISFETFSRLLAKFGNVTSLVVRNVDQLSDCLLFMITHQCRNLQSLSFTNCAGLDREEDNQHAPFNCLTGVCACHCVQSRDRTCDIGYCPVTKSSGNLSASLTADYQGFSVVSFDRPTI